MADLILPRSLVITSNIMNYFMTAPVAGIALPATTATDIGPGVAGLTWLDDTGATVTAFAVDPSSAPAGHQYFMELYVDGQKQQEGLITAVTTTTLVLTSTTAGTIPGSARIVFTVVDVGAA